MSLRRSLTTHDSRVSATLFVTNKTLITALRYETLPIRKATAKIFPIRDESLQINIPYVTYALIALNIIAWFDLQDMGAEPVLSQSICQFSAGAGGSYQSNMFFSFEPLSYRQS